MARSDPCLFEPRTQVRMIRWLKSQCDSVKKSWTTQETKERLVVIVSYWDIWFLSLLRILVSTCQALRIQICSESFFGPLLNAQTPRSNRLVLVFIQCVVCHAISPVSLLDDIALRRIVPVVQFSSLFPSDKQIFSCISAYRRSFSIKSTCVSIMRRQQYLFKPSWSIASLRISCISFRFESGEGARSSL